MWYVYLYQNRFISDINIYFGFRLKWTRICNLSVISFFAIINQWIFFGQKRNQIKTKQKSVDFVSIYLTSKNYEFNSYRLLGDSHGKKTPGKMMKFQFVDQCVECIDGICIQLVFSVTGIEEIIVEWRIGQYFDSAVIWTHFFQPFQHSVRMQLQTNSMIFSFKFTKNTQ